MSWFARAACKGADPNVWFPTTDDDSDASDNHGREAKAICATCSVKLDCLVDALERNEDGGIWGGAGEDIRRHLARRLREATHELDILPDVCGCRWCAAVRSHFAALDGEPIDNPDETTVLAVLSDGRVIYAETGPTNRNGPGATHGRRVTYNRGCRCPACCFAVAQYGQDQKFEQRSNRTA